MGFVKHDYDNIPAEMKALPQWVCYFRTPKLKKDGTPDYNSDGTPRMNKLPVNPRTLKGAKSTEPQHWTDFNTALSSVGKNASVAGNTGTVEGIGFVFRASDVKESVCGVDLDHVINTETGELHPAAAELVADFDSYTELSPSGSGLHIYYKGKRHSDWGRKIKDAFGSGTEFEMYQTERFFTVTGNSYGESRKLKSADDAAEKYYRRLASAHSKQKSRSSDTVRRNREPLPVSADTVFSDDKVIEKASRSRKGANFSALMNGDTSAYGGDQSRADQALCNILAFWCGGNLKQIDRIFRQSGLMRDKWDEKRGALTYGERTITEAVNGCGGFYDPQYRQRAAIKEFTDIVPQGSTKIRALAGDGTVPLPESPESDDYEESAEQIRALAKENALDGRIYRFCEEYLEDTEEIELFLEEYVRPCAKEQKRLSDFKDKSKRLLKKISDARKEKERAELRASFVEKRKEMEAQLPNWVWIDERGKRHLNEPRYMDEFAAKHQLKFFSGSFYEIDGFITELALCQKIQKELELYFTERIAQLTKRVVDGMKNRFFIEDMPPCAEKIHIQGGYITIDGSGLFTHFIPKMEFCLNRLNISYDRAARQPQRFLRYLREVFKNDDIRTIQQFLGYCLIPTNKLQLALIIHGKGGEGKSQLGEILYSIIGEKNLIQNKIQAVQDRFGLANCANKLIYIDDDTDGKALQTTGNFKKLVTSKGKMEAEKKNVQQNSAQFYVRFLCFGNNIIEALYDDSDGFRRRLLILQTKSKEAERRNVRDLAQKIIAEEKEGIFLWLLDGLNELIKNGWELYVSDESRALSDKLKCESDTVNLFFTENPFIEFQRDSAMHTSDIYNQYYYWCSDNALKAVTKQRFAKTLYERRDEYGIEYIPQLCVNNQRARGYRGIHLTRMYSSGIAEPQHTILN